MDDYQMEMLRLASKGYTCSQIIVRIGLAARAEENPSLVRAMAGLAYGCGSGQASCGALTGGCCLLALYAGKGSDAEAASEHLPLMLNQLSVWFRTAVGGRHGGIDCEAITGEGGPAAARQRCGSIVGDTVAKAMKILAAHGFDIRDARA
jgi:hypothetical protein